MSTEQMRFAKCISKRAIFALFGGKTSLFCRIMSIDYCRHYLTGLPERKQEGLIDLKNKPRKLLYSNNLRGLLNGGEGGIRTPGTGFIRYGGLANHCLQPLGHLSMRTGSHKSGGHHTRKSRAPSSAKSNNPKSLSLGQRSGPRIPNCGGGKTRRGGRYEAAG